MSNADNSCSVHKTPLQDVIEEIRKRLGELQEFTANNPNVFQDDIALKPYKASTNIQWSINSALNHLQTSCDFGVPDSVTSMPAFTLLRAAIEHASLAIWLIDEDNSDVRRRNNLAFTFESFEQADKLEAHLPTNQKIRLGQQLSRINDICKSLQVATLPGKSGELLSISKRVEFAGELLVKCGIGTESNNLARALYGRASLVTHANSYSAFGLFGAGGIVVESQDAVQIMPIAEKQTLEYFEFVSIRLIELALNIYEYRSGRAVSKYPRFNLD